MKEICLQREHDKMHTGANVMALAERLGRGIAALDLSVDAGMQCQLLGYAALLGEWSDVLHMTNDHCDELAIVNCILDCLAVLPHISLGAIADVGSGAGFPGIPLAIARPHYAVTLIESNHKKSEFLRAAVLELGLANVEVVSERVESWSGQRNYKTVISRALGDLEDFARLAGGLCATGGTLVAMKNVYPHEELAQIPAPFRLRRVIPLNSLNECAGRYLVLLDPEN